MLMCFLVKDFITSKNKSIFDKSINVILPLFRSIDMPQRHLRGMYFYYLLYTICFYYNFNGYLDIPDILFIYLFQIMYIHPIEQKCAEISTVEIKATVHEKSDNTSKIHINFSMRMVQFMV